MHPPTPNFTYRPEIDGLRAIAVLAVVFFHVGLGVPGGYVGVDVFFVISGFLITSLILKDLESDKFSLANFWERRARRILPALMVMVLVTLIAGWFLLLPGDYTNLGRSAAWQSVFAANIHYWINTGYFTGAGDEKPLLHTWSLAVEEQFYMGVPLLLLGLFRIQAFRRRGFLLSLLALAIGLSLIVSIWTVAHHPAAAFYLLPTRSWELLCGAFVAILPQAWRPSSHARRELFSLIGLIAILIPCWIYSKSTTFPGIAAVPPCFGAALFIWACSKESQPKANVLPLAGRFLALPPLVFVGLISYSLYLWHWPLIAYSKYWALGPFPLSVRIGLIVLSCVIATLSWRYVETPFRIRQICETRPSMLAFSATCIIVVFAFGGILVWGKGFDTRFPARALEYARAKEGKDGIHGLTAEDIRAGRLITIGNPALDVPVSFLLWGDSHAMAAAPAFDFFLKERGIAGRQATASATAPLLGAYWRNEFTSPKSATAFNDAVFDYIKEHKIPYVVLAGFWEYYTDDKGTIPLNEAMLSTVNKLVEIGSKPYLLLQVPHQTFEVPKGLAMSSIFNYNLTPYLAKPTGWNGLRGEGDFLIKKLEAAGCSIIDPRPYFMDKGKQYFVVEKDGKSLYRDSHHLSSSGARAILEPILGKTFQIGKRRGAETDLLD